MSALFVVCCCMLVCCPCHEGVGRKAQHQLSLDLTYFFLLSQVQQKVVAQRHNIDGRWCDVRIPNSKGGETECSKKIFVGRVSEDVTKADLKDYFSQFGDVRFLLCG